jgi:hypothetical protein
MLRSMPISGFLDLGTSFSGSTLVTPGSGVNYAAQPISFTAASGAVILNGVSCMFGPVSGSWGTLVGFQVSDANANVYWAGTLASPFIPLNGQIVTVPQGNITLVVGAQFVATPVNTVSPAQGPTVSGSVALASDSYSLVLASGARRALLLNNVASSGLVQLLLGGTLPPDPAAAGYTVIKPLDSWPPAAFGDFVPTDSIWALGTVPGMTLNYIIG